MHAAVAPDTEDAARPGVRSVTRTGSRSKVTASRVPSLELTPWLHSLTPKRLFSCSKPLCGDTYLGFRVAKHIPNDRNVSTGVSTSLRS